MLHPVEALRGTGIFSTHQVVDNRLNTADSLLWKLVAGFFLFAKCNIVSVCVLNGPICCPCIRYMKLLWIPTATRRSTMHLVRRMKKWSHAHRRGNLPLHSLCPAQTLLRAPLKTRMLLRMWQVNSHNPCSGHCPLTPKCVYCTRLPGPPKGKAVRQHMSLRSPFH